jgi:hypothetical protein
MKLVVLAAIVAFILGGVAALVGGSFGTLPHVLAFISFGLAALAASLV